MFGLTTEERWAAALAPERHGRTAVVTGAGSGIGLATAAALARPGTHMVPAVRDPGRPARDERAWRRLWEQSDGLLGVTYGG
ncbi:hypothetical protein [Streptomyces sp. NPDC088730]|uniref:hypothetical protein n=1 Tax=Streptomyces sp. NPDC088730 TaxID=3365877 RepID=UPI003816F994